MLNRGTFLVASPDLDTPLFQRGVVLICEHSPSGSFGLLINKPIDIELPPEILNLEQALNHSFYPRAGGPLQPNQLMVLHTASKETHPGVGLEIIPGVTLGGDLSFLKEALGNPGGPKLLLCFGYMNWGPGQLEEEIMEGAWAIAPGNVEDLFESEPHLLWAEMLRRIGGKYSALSMLPDDLSLN